MAITNGDAIQNDFRQWYRRRAGFLDGYAPVWQQRPMATDIIRQASKNLVRTYLSMPVQEQVTARQDVLNMRAIINDFGDAALPQVRDLTRTLARHVPVVGAPVVGAPAPVVGAPAPVVGAPAPVVGPAVAHLPARPIAPPRQYRPMVPPRRPPRRPVAPPRQYAQPPPGTPVRPHQDILATVNRMNNENILDTRFVGSPSPTRAVAQPPRRMLHNLRNFLTSPVRLRGRGLYEHALVSRDYPIFI